MICLKCNKLYSKKAYYEKHIQKNNCIIEANNISLKENTIVNQQKKISKKEQLEILDQDIDEIISRVLKQPDSFEEVSELKKVVESLKNEIYFLKDKVKDLENIWKNSNEFENEQQKDTKGIIIDGEETNINTDDIKTVKKERMLIDDDIVKNYLNSKSIESDCELLYKYYLENIKKNFYPIKRSKNKKYDCCYWNGDDWVEDPAGNNLKSIFTSNLKKVYNRINIHSEPEYLNNQEHINDIVNNKRYQNSLYCMFMDKYFI